MAVCVQKPLEVCNATITTAVTSQVQNTLGVNKEITAAKIQAVFTYGSGGTNATAYVQSTIDGGVTWFDVACFQFTTSTATSQVSVNSRTAVTTPRTPTNGSLTANTAVDGIFSDLWRCVLTTTGTYAGGTTIKVTVLPIAE